MIRHFRAIALALALPLAASAQTAGPATEGAEAPAETRQSPFEPELREALRAEIRAYILDNPELIIEAMQVLEARRNAAAEVADADRVARHAEALFEDPHSWVGGNPEGEITLVEFSDYRCGFCKRVHPAVKEALERDDNFRLIIREYPILGPDSVTAGRMAMAALDIDPSRYRALNDALMAYRGNLTEAASYRIANEVGYEIAALKARAQSEEIRSRLEANLRLAQALELSGTPSFVLGDRILRGFMPLEEMLALVDEVSGAAN